MDEEFPRLSVVQTARDGARYFGLTDVGAMKETVKLARRLFPIALAKHLTRSLRPV